MLLGMFWLSQLENRKEICKCKLWKLRSMKTIKQKQTGNFLFNLLSLCGLNLFFLMHTVVMAQAMIPKSNAIESWMKSREGEEKSDPLFTADLHHAPCRSNLPIDREAGSWGFPQLRPKGEFICPALPDQPQPRENQESGNKESYLGPLL